MRILCCLMISFLTGIKCFSQFRDTYQPAAVYKQNQVKSRSLMFDYSPYQTRAIDFFDHNGLLTEHIDFDTTRGQYFRRENLQYDSTQKLVSGILYMYSRFDTATKKYKHIAVADTVLIKIERDTIKRIFKKTEVNKAGKIIYEATYTAEPLSSTEKFFNEDSSITEIVIEYEIPYVERKATCTYYSPGGKTQTCTYAYKNSFDKTGKIKRRKLERECDGTGGENNKPYFREYNYQYMSNGLLINRTSSGQTDDDRWRSGQLFDYKFW